MKNQSHDNSKIPLPEDPVLREKIQRIMSIEQTVFDIGTSRKHFKKDYRFQLSYAMAETEDFLRETSRDPYYQKSNSINYYAPGGWL